MSLIDNQFRALAFPCLSAEADDPKAKQESESPFLRFVYVRAQSMKPPVIFATNIPATASAKAVESIRWRQRRSKSQKAVPPRSVEQLPVPGEMETIAQLDEAMLLQKHRINSLSQHARIHLPNAFLESQDGSWDLDNAGDSDSDSDSDSSEGKVGAKKIASGKHKGGKANYAETFELVLPTKTDALPKPLDSRRGIAAWIKEYKDDRPDLIKLQTHINKVVDEYDKREKKVIEKREKEKLPDEDGWITVHHGKKSGPAPKKMTRKMKKEKVLEDFYAFQRREKKVQRLAELRRKFEEDKERIAKMKASRKFKPY